ncbi:lipid-A-disaccharide synthase N-terminal domain-containing protein [Croceibacter atlanticus]|jgi:lipid-A-disaccharide synthase-like uncharacterized protein|uniref:lipid-A-disaccharide synthase N-terminal domain-containing protein n=1 Tax=Croceibacter atlanticus TaxID=313588 RepID=UPI0030DD570F|tara:strand:- start:171465 stop:172091 length:627 start_codon:yes stop_codon:yes gene_type:complete
MNDWLIYAVGFFAQLLFSGRTLHQWLTSEKKKKVVTPSLFWKLGLLAAFILLIYGYLRQDFAIILGQFFMYYIYVRNLQIQKVWDSFYNFFKILILALPVLCVLGVVLFGTMDTEMLFKNEDIPFWLLTIGVVGQIVFSTRFIYQWLYSEARQKSSLPFGFWLLSLIGSVIVIFYALFRKDPVLFVGHFFGLIVYVRNIILIRNAKSQ